jgi:hypothetical protein
MMWKKALIALATVGLLTAGLAIIIYVAVARDRIAPTPTARPVRASSPIPSLTPDSALVTPAARPTVVGRVRDYTPGALIIVIDPIEGQVEQIIVPENLTIVWSDGKRASPRDIVPGQTLSAEGTLDTLGRLVADKITIAQGAEQRTPSPTRTATPKPLPSSTPVPTVAISEWRGEYYANRDLAGNPLVRNDANINFDWGQGAPASQMPVDNFSARWTRTLSFDEGAYRFSARVDDGIKVWVDGLLIIDAWRTGAPITYAGYIWLSGGPHAVKVEYFEATGGALVGVWWEKLSTFNNWKGEYYNNADLAGHPVFVRDDANVDADWQGGSPGNGIPVDNFSVRWSRTLPFNAGRYRYWALADDGVRIYVDGALLIDQWHDATTTRYEGEALLAQGQHNIVIEYYERRTNAFIRIGWEQVGTPTPTATLTLTATPTALPATATPTRTAVPPTAAPTATATLQPTTAVPTATLTPIPPTVQPSLTLTPPPPTAAATPTATPNAPTPTVTPMPPANPSSTPTAAESLATATCTCAALPSPTSDIETTPTSTPPPSATTEPTAQPSPSITLTPASSETDEHAS